MNDNENNLRPLFGLIDIGTITSILIPLLYTAGWSFAYRYFSYFHLGLIGLDIQREYLFIYGFWVIKNHWFLSLLTIMVMVIIYMVVCWYYKLGIKLKHKYSPYKLEYLVLFSIPTTIISMFVLFYQMGASTAQEIYEQQAKSYFSSYPRVKVWLNEKSVVGTGEIENQWSKECYRLLLRNKDNLYVFNWDKITRKTPVDIIPQSHVRMVRVLPFYNPPESCD